MGIELNLGNKHILLNHSIEKQNEEHTKKHHRNVRFLQMAFSSRHKEQLVARQMNQTY